MPLEGHLCGPCANEIQGRMRVKKSNLSARVAAEASLSRADAETAVNAVIGFVGDVLARGETVSIAGFGTFSVKDRPARQGRNPRTGESIAIAASKVPSFKAGKGLRGAIGYLRRHLCLPGTRSDRRALAHVGRSLRGGHRRPRWRCALGGLDRRILVRIEAILAGRRIASPLGRTCDSFAVDDGELGAWSGGTSGGSS